MIAEKFRLPVIVLRDKKSFMTWEWSCIGLHCVRWFMLWSNYMSIQLCNATVSLHVPYMFSQCLHGTSSGVLASSHSLKTRTFGWVQEAWRYSISTAVTGTGDMAVQWLALPPHSKKFCVEFAGSPCVCVSSLHVPWLPPTGQKYPCVVNWKL